MSKKFHQKSDLHLLLMTDLHLLSAELMDEGPALWRKTLSGDGKLLPWLPPLFSAFLHRVMQIHPDLLLLCGDQTFNGEEMSHWSLYHPLRALNHLGIPVATLPGNHDVLPEPSWGFSQNSTYEVPRTSSTFYQALNESLTNFSTLSKDPTSLSRLLDLPGERGLLLLDVNLNADPGAFTEASFQWLQKTLAEHPYPPGHLLCATHQTMLIHNPRFVQGFRFVGATKVRDLLLAHGVSLTLCGHMHLQHIAEEQGLTEAATGSLAVYPHHFAHIYWSADGTLTYQTEALDPLSWAREFRPEDPFFMDFRTNSAIFFRRLHEKKLRKELQAFGLAPSDQDRMLPPASKILCAAFTGEARSTLESLQRDPGLLLWRRPETNLPFYAFLDSLEDEPLLDHNQRTLFPRGESPITPSKNK